MAENLTRACKTAPPKRPDAVPECGGKHYNRYLLKRCLTYFWPYKWKIALATLAMLLAGLCDAGTAYLVKPAMDEIFLNKDKAFLVLIPIAYLIITLVKNGGKLTQNYMMQSVGLKVLEVLRDQLFTKIIRLPLRYYEGAQVGHLMSRVINDVALIRGSMPAIIILVRQIVTMVSLMFVVYYQDWKLALLATVVLPVAFLPFVYFGKRLRRLSRKGQAIYADASVVLNEILSGIRVVKAFSNEDEESDRFDRENRRLLRVALKQSMSGEFSSAAMELVGAFAIGLVLYYGGSQVIEGQSTPGTFFSFVAALALLYEPVKKITNANNNIQAALSGAERVFEILDSDKDVEETGGDVELPTRPGELELRLENVDFNYNPEAAALKNVNLTIRQGERLAIVGPSGAGKTTFVNLIPRFYDPSSGRITLNGVDLREYSLPSLRKNISIVSQDNFLFNQTVRENIAYGQPGFTDEQVIRAARAAYAHDFIMDMPEGYGTVVGERGVRLSGGQKQRLTIARAIAKDAPILILDEATSALDSESEKIVQKALENLMQGRTSIVIAHRLSTVLASDRIVVMQNGVIEAVGRHRELLETSPLYSKLYAMQFGESE